MMRSLPLLAAPLPLTCLALSVAEAQAPNPQIPGFQVGCFIRHNQAYNLTVKPVMAATVNGQKVCREATPLEPPSGQKPATR